MHFVIRDRESMLKCKSCAKKITSDSMSSVTKFNSKLDLRFLRSLLLEVCSFIAKPKFFSLLTLEFVILKRTLGRNHFAPKTSLLRTIVVFFVDSKLHLKHLAWYVVGNDIWKAFMILPPFWDQHVNLLLNGIRKSICLQSSFFDRTSVCKEICVICKIVIRNGFWSESSKFTDSSILHRQRIEFCK